MKTISIRVRGKVQGVWFRKYTVDKAIAFNITGYVKNLPDSSVAIIATGNEDQLQHFIEWCWQGSPKSRVEDVTVTDIELEEFHEFRIDR